MNPAVDKLTKFLSLEAKRGYDNRAVVGGLQRMLEPWEAEARQYGVPEPIIELVVSRLRDYPSLIGRSREEALHGIWNRLVREYPDVRARRPAGMAPSTPPAESQESQPATPAPAAKAHPDESETVAAGPSASTRQVPQEVTLPSEADQPSERRTAPPKPPPARITPRKPWAPPPGTSEEPASLDASLTTVPGIGPKSAKTLRKLGLEVLGDLLWYFPRRYDDYSQLKTINRIWFGEDVTIIGTVEDINLRPIRDGKMRLVEAVISDGTGSLRVTWFNQPWITQRLNPGRPVALSGKVDQYLGRLTMNNPEWEPLEKQQLHTNRIVPVYPLTAGVTVKWLRRVINSVVTRLAARVPDPLPESVRQSAGLVSLNFALLQIHFPDSWDDLKLAQNRLAFDEMFLLQLGVLRQKRAWHELTGRPRVVDDPWLERFQSALPFELTNAQRKAMQDVREDMASEHPMNRLIQGDVGSGKTVVAAVAAGIAAANGAQSAVMAPTSILAEQHHHTLLEILRTAAGIPPESVRLLIGATPEEEKDELRLGLQDGSIKVIVGTHALIEGPVNFSDLGLVVIDEQHRFGVEQRAALRAKGENPNLMVMTATPIPRSLTLTLYGDLDLTVIDEMPPGRQPVETHLLRPIERERALNFTIGQLEQGRQAYIIFPLIEGSGKVEAMAAVDEFERLQKEAFTRYRLGLLHGRMNTGEKEETMQRFRDGQYDALVSTSVVEVGVDIPNATVMVIEGANRFGLAQLHQFRGRVGRGEHKSYCLLIAESDSAAENERLKAMEAIDDGFRLAELDLEQRGPGDFLGTRQAGFAELRAAHFGDVRLIEKARREAIRLLEADPHLEMPESDRLRAALERFWAPGTGEIS